MFYFHRSTAISEDICGHDVFFAKKNTFGISYYAKLLWQSTEKFQISMFLWKITDVFLFARHTENDIFGYLA